MSHPGLLTLEPAQLRLLRDLESVFVAWADEVGAAERRYPPLVAVADLQRFDYFENFPQLGLAAAGLEADAARAADRDGALDGVLATDLLAPTDLLLPSAACYSVYLQAADRVLRPGGELHTLVAQCFRREQEYPGLTRQLGFTMREIVCIAEPSAATEHLERFEQRVRDLLDTLGLDARLEIATDPFFDADGRRAAMQRLFPVKREFVVDDVAIASLNYHRNFFAERCRIALADGDLAHTSCVAFGLERWVHALTTRFGSPEAASRALEDLRG